MLHFGFVRLFSNKLFYLQLHAAHYVTGRFAVLIDVAGKTSEAVTASQGWLLSNMEQQPLSKLLHVSKGLSLQRPY